MYTAVVRARECVCVSVYECVEFCDLVVLFSSSLIPSFVPNPNCIPKPDVYSYSYSYP